MTENKGDLISREALKKEMQKADIKANDYETLAKMYENCVDNAPTVEPETSRLALIEDIRKKQMDADKAFLEGYERGKNERPQGEWVESHIFSCGKILRMQLDVIEHKCKHCGRWSIKWVGTIPDNFCSYCGASIKEVKKND